MSSRAFRWYAQEASKSRVYASAYFGMSGVGAYSVVQASVKWSSGPQNPSSPDAAKEASSSPPSVGSPSDSAVLESDTEGIFDALNVTTWTLDELQGFDEKQAGDAERSM